jgi:hypothetical protein
MDVYTYRATLWCEDCTDHIKRHLPMPKHVDEGDESSYDSDDWPKGPTTDDECDYPSHCEGCQVFLQNRLTDDGARYVAHRLLGGNYAPNDPVVVFYSDYHEEIAQTARLMICAQALGAPPEFVANRLGLLNPEEVRVERPTLDVTVWWDADATPTGWYWDATEDSGGFDRVSPRGPYFSREAAVANALSFSGSESGESRLLVRITGARPLHYPEPAIRG